MKNLFIILILTLSLTTLTKANDIRDLEIEGISIGNSVLEFFSKKEIKDEINKTKYHYNYLKDPTKFREVYIFRQNYFKKYESVSLMFKEKDNKYKISFIRGMKNYTENLKSCFSQLNEISKEIENNFPKVTKNVREHKSDLDKSGKSISYNTYYTFASGDGIILACNNWEEKFRKKNNYSEGLSVVIRTNEVRKWLQGK